MAARQYVIGGPGGGFVVNEVSTRQFNAFGAYVDATYGTAYAFSVASTSLALTARSITPATTRPLAPTRALLSIIGEPLTIPTTRRMAVANGTLSLVGESVSLPTVRPLGVAATAISLAGRAISIPAARNLGIAGASLAITGPGVSVPTARAMAIASTALTFAARPILTPIARVVSVATAAFSLLAQVIGFVRQRLSPPIEITAIVSVDPILIAGTIIEAIQIAAIVPRVLTQATSGEIKCDIEISNLVA